MSSHAHLVVDTIRVGWCCRQIRDPYDIIQCVVKDVQGRIYVEVSRGVTLMM